MKDFLQTQKEYFFSLKPQIYFTIIIFLIGIISGYALVGIYPEETGGFIDELIEKYLPIFETGKFNQFIFLFLSNALTMFFVSVGGVLLGLFPFVSLLVNGMALGMVANFSKEFISVWEFLAGILPHGIIEIPALILGGATGFRLGSVFFGMIFKKHVNLKKEISLVLNFYLKFLLPLLFLAAFIEIFITSWIIGV